MKIHSLLIAALCLASMGAGFAQKVVPSHAIANLVLGQSNFDERAPGAPVSSFGMHYPSAVVVDPLTRKVFVADSRNGRVLRFGNAGSLRNGDGAEAVFGKPSFGENGSDTPGQQGLSSSLGGIFIDRKGRLWVADARANRVLCYEAAVFRTSYPYADRVIGQPDFDTTSPGITAAKLDSPSGVWVDPQDRLWVADRENNRVLRFDSITTKSNGAEADGVLGQKSFTSSAKGAGAAKFDFPLGICVNSSGTLFVADLNNHRVLRFPNAASLANGAAATGVLGQPDLRTTSSGTNRNTLGGPYGVWPTPGDDLWVLDTNNQRVLRFANASTIPSGSPAATVVGQPSFTSNSAATSNRRLYEPAFFPFADVDGSLWVPDNGNNRVLRFPPDATPPLLAIAPRPPASTNRARQSIKGTARDFYGVSKVHYSINQGPVRTAVGRERWRINAPLRKGINRIRIYALDSVGNRSPVRIVRIRRN